MLREIALNYESLAAKRAVARTILTSISEEEELSAQVKLAHIQAPLFNQLPADLKELLEADPARTQNQNQLSRIRSYYLQSVCVETKPRFKEQQTRIEAIAKERSAYEAQIPSTFIWRDLPTPRQSFVMKRGEYDNPGEEVQPDTPAVLPPLTKSDPG